MAPKERARLRALLVRFGMDRLPTHDASEVFFMALEGPRKRIDTIRDALVAGDAAPDQYREELAAHTRMLASLVEALEIWLDVEMHRELFGEVTPLN